VRGSGGTVVVSDGADVVARRSVATPDPEFADVDGAALLATLAARSGGEVVHPAAVPPPGAPPPPRCGRGPPLLALLLALIEFAWRRYGPDDEGSSSGASTSTFMSSRKRVVA
jgi:hypothetical protein